MIAGRTCQRCDVALGKNLRPAHRQCNVDKGERYPAWWELRQAGIAA